MSATWRGGKKLTTGLVGLPVVSNSREVFMRLCKKFLSAVAVVPPTAAYRIEMERVTRHRLSVCEKHTDVATIERTIGAGQLEELIEDTKSELEYVPEYARSLAWQAYSDGSAKPVPIVVLPEGRH
mmetsp:Transcript_35551/g.86973  ORF Transcript_35551/g.86973 Transcript_35551/m.86973 type:complete len:126 (+) Transcript_35551:92-469(+)